jgi:hypothetical protein
MKEARDLIERQRVLLEGLVETLTKKAHAKTQNYRHKEAEQIYKAIEAVKSANSELYFGELELMADAA